MMVAYIIAFIITILLIIYTVKAKQSSAKNKTPINKVISRSGMKEAKYSGKMFSISEPTKISSKTLSPKTEVDSNILKEDFLAMAAEAGHRAKEAAKSKRYDEAWGLFHEQKTFYIKHADRFGFSSAHALALDATVHENLADILRREGKNNDALIHILYWILASSKRPLKRHEKKFNAYYNRCKFKNTTLKDAEYEVVSKVGLPPFAAAQSLVQDWVNRG